MVSIVNERRVLYNPIRPIVKKILWIMYYYYQIQMKWMCPCSIVVVYAKNKPFVFKKDNL